MGLGESKKALQYLNKLIHIVSYPRLAIDVNVREIFAICDALTSIFLAIRVEDTITSPWLFNSLTYDKYQGSSRAPVGYFLKIRFDISLFNISE